MKRQIKRSIKKFRLNALVWREDDWYVAKTLEIEVTSQGRSVKEALANLEEALELYFADEKVSLESMTTLPELRLEKLFPKIQYA